MTKIVENPSGPPTVDADWGKPGSPNAFVAPLDVAVSPVNGKIYVRNTTR